MKIKKILYKLILVTMSIVMCNYYNSFAMNEGLQDPNLSLYDNNIGSSSTVQGDESLGLPTLNGSYKPEVQGGKVLDITNKLLGVIMVIGVIGITVFIALTGFGTILGSANEKAVAKEKYAGYLVAAILITCGAGIAKVIISVAETFG